MRVQVGGPWVCTMELKDKPLAVGGGWNAAMAQPKVDIGDRTQNLVFIGQNMCENKAKIIEQLDYCLVDDNEWAEMCKNKLTQKFEVDPFAGVQGVQEH